MIRAAAFLLCLVAVVAQAQNKTDRHGDPLPPGAVARIGSVRFKHTAPVNSVSWSSDGKWIAAGDNARLIVIWNAASGRRVRTLRGHKKKVQVVRFAGRLIVSSSDDQTVRVWDPRTGKCLRVIPNSIARALAVSPDGKTLSLDRGLVALDSGKLIWDAGSRRNRSWSSSFSANGKMVALGGDPPQVKVRQVPGGKLLWTIEGHQRGLISPDGKQLSTLTDHHVAVWDLLTGARLTRYKQADWVRSRAHSPDGALFATGGFAGKIVLWDTVTGKRRRVLRGVGRRGIRSLSFSADGKRLVSGGHTGLVEVWQVATGKRLNPVEPHPGGALSVTFGAAGILATGGRGGVVKLWARAEQVKTLTKTGPPVRQLAFSSNGKQLVSSGKIRIWNVNTGELIRAFRNFGSGMRALQFSRDGTLLLLAGLDRAGFNWVRVANGSLQLKVPTWWRPAGVVARIRPDGSALLAGQSTSGAVYFWTRRTGLRTVRYREENQSMALAPNGSLLALASTARGVELWDTASATIRLVIDRPAICVAFSPGDRMLAVASGSGVVRLYATQDGRVLRKLRFDGGPTAQLAFSRDSRKLAAVSALGTVVVHDLPVFAQVPVASKSTSLIRRRLTHPRARHLESVMSIRFSPAGDTFVTRSADAIRLWDVKTARLLLKIDGTGSELFRFSPAGKRLAVATLDRMVRIWDCKTGRALAVCAGHAGEVLALDWSPDGRLLATGGRGRGVNLWDSASGTRLRVLTGGARGEFTALAFAPDGASLATANDDRRIRRFATASGKLLQEIPTEAKLTALGYSPEGQTLVGLAQATLWLWNLKSGKLRAGFASLTYVESLAFSADGKQLALGRRSRLQLWDIEQARVIRSLTMPGAGASTVHLTRAGRLVGTLRGAKVALRSWDLRSGKSLYRGTFEPIPDLDLSPDGRLMVLSEVFRGLHLVNLATGARLARFERSASVNSLAFSPDGRALALTQGKQLRLIDLASGRHKRLLVHPGELTAAAFDPTGTWIVSGGAGPTIRLSLVQPAKPDPVIAQLIVKLGARRFSQRATALRKLRLRGLLLYPHLSRHRKQTDLEVRAKVRRLLSSLRASRCHDVEIAALAISPDGRTIASVCRICRLTLWDGKTRRELLHKPLELRLVSYSPDGRLLAFATPSEVRVHDTGTGKQRYRIACKTGAYSLLFSPDGKVLVLGAGPGILLYDSNRGQKLGTLVHGEHVSLALAYAADGSWIASGGFSSVLLWSMHDRRVVRIYQGHVGLVTDVAFSPDSKRLVASDGHGRVILWKLPKK